MAYDITVITSTGATTYSVSTGSRGPQGAAGEGVPAGGSTGQVLTKTSGTDYDTEWAAPAGGHDPVTITGNGLSLSGQQLSLSIGTGATQVAAGNHTHGYVDELFGTATSLNISAAVLTGEITFNTGTSFVYGTGIAAAHRTALGGVPMSDPTGVTGADAITNIISLTQAEYNAITPNSSTLYVIT